MKIKIIGFTALVSLVIPVLVSCLSFDTNRAPSSEASSVFDHLMTDEFTEAGFMQAADRNFGAGKIPEKQLIQELAGRSIWFKSAPNERHHTYLFPQKLGVAIDWNQAFSADVHETRFRSWGLINDPDCCVPGSDCEQKGLRYNGRAVTSADTFGWNYCAGDEALLNSLRGGAVFRDPACADSLLRASDALDPKIRENRCELAFGTSAGAVGFRKFPNPRFNAKRWEAIGGYKGYSESMIREGINNSIQPPFRVGLACASCHAAFDPVRPPSDPSHPSWVNINGDAGNQFLNMSRLMASGMKASTLEAQLFTHTRPGTVDTSVVPHDYINNPGTMNAVINLPARPLFDEKVSRWVASEGCDAQNATCQKLVYNDEAGRAKGYRFWEWKTLMMKVPHILKGGEDSTGYDLGVQRVYLNNGLCAEQCFTNHLTNLRELDVGSRGFGETPFDIGQCRRECGAFRANEDRAGDIISFLSSSRPAELRSALNKSESEFKIFVEGRYGAGSVERGRKIFAANCAQCHSTEGGDPSALKTIEGGEIIRADWFGNDQSTPVTEVGTYKCRALHSNHKKGRVWQDFSSDSHKALPPVVSDAFGRPVAGGPGYYRNISLLSVWAYAPFLHNNSVGPEICAQGLSPDLVRTDAVCDRAFDPSVAGRLELFDLSVDELLTPAAQRPQKITRLTAPLRFPLGFGGRSIEFPAGLPLNLVANFDLKAFVYDFTYASRLLEKSGMNAYRSYWKSKFGGNSPQARELGDAVLPVVTSFSLDGLPNIAKYYKTCEAGNESENGGHEFQTGLSATDKRALKAFLVTL